MAVDGKSYYNEEYKSRCEEWSKEMGRLLLDFPQKLHINSSIFYEKLGAELNIDPDSIKNYIYKGIPQKYLDDEFESFIGAIKNALKRYADHLPSQEECMFRERWRSEKKDLLNALEKIHYFVQRNKWMKHADEPLYKEKLFLLDFLLGHIPEDHRRGYLNKSEIEELRRACLKVYPNMITQLLRKGDREDKKYYKTHPKSDKNHVDLDFY